MAYEVWKIDDDKTSSELLELVDKGIVRRLQASCVSPSHLGDFLLSEGMTPQIVESH